MEKKYCPKCGTELHTDYLFCTKCGMKQIPQDSVEIKQEINTDTSKADSKSEKKEAESDAKDTALGCLALIIIAGLIYWFASSFWGDSSTSAIVPKFGEKMEFTSPMGDQLVTYTLIFNEDETGELTSKIHGYEEEESDNSKFSWKVYKNYGYTKIYLSREITVFMKERYNSHCVNLYLNEDGIFLTESALYAKDYGMGTQIKWIEY